MANLVNWIGKELLCICKWVRTFQVQIRSTYLLISFFLIYSVEALAAAFYITGHQKIAEKYLSKFSWGHSFISLNQGLLDEYAKCKDADEVIKAQEAFLEKEREEELKRKNAEIDLPPTDDSETESESESEES